MQVTVFRFILFACLFSKWSCTEIHIFYTIIKNITKQNNYKFFRVILTFFRDFHIITTTFCYVCCDGDLVLRFHVDNKVVWGGTWFTTIQANKSGPHFAMLNSCMRRQITLRRECYTAYFTPKLNGRIQANIN